MEVSRRQAERKRRTRRRERRKREKQVKSEVSGDTRVQQKQIISHQSRRGAVLKRTWETQDWPGRWREAAPDWPDGVWNDPRGTEKLPKYGSELWELTFTTQIVPGRSEKSGERRSEAGGCTCDCWLTAWKVTSGCDWLNGGRSSFTEERKKKKEK